MSKYYVAKFFAINNSSRFIYTKGWNIKEVLPQIDPSKYYGFQFETRTKDIIKEEQSYTVIPHIIETSGIYYINGYIETYEDIKARKDPSEYTLLRKMKNLGWKNIVRNVKGRDWCFTFFEKDQIVDVSTCATQ